MQNSNSQYVKIGRFPNSRQLRHVACKRTGAIGLSSRVLTLALMLASFWFGLLVRSECRAETRTEVVPSEQPPNILLILVDDLGKDWIGCYGADNIETPQIDSLATQGMLCHNVYSMPQCTPTRLTLLTGQYPFRTGWVNHWDVPRWGDCYFDWHEYRTFASELRSAGYATAIAGKWQINDFRMHPDALDRHGFDDWCMWTGYEKGNPPSDRRYWDAYIHQQSGSQTYEGEFGPDIYCNFLVDFIEQHHNRPMLLYYPMCLTHGPLTTTPDEPQASRKSQHAAMVRYMDRLVGRVLDALDAHDLADNTLVIFTTDNGTAGGLRGTIGGVRPSGGKATYFEGGCCMPFIVRWPNQVPAGSESTALIDFSDIAPTLFEVAGHQVDEPYEMDGRSFANVLTGDAESTRREWILAMGRGPAMQDDQGVRGIDDFAPRVLRDTRYKAWFNNQRQLYRFHDLEFDPGEQHNLLDENLELTDSVDRDARNSWETFRSAVDEMLPIDARPRYRRNAR